MKKLILCSLLLNNAYSFTMEHLDSTKKLGLIAVGSLVAGLVSRHYKNSYQKESFNYLTSIHYNSGKDLNNDIDEYNKRSSTDINFTPKCSIPKFTGHCLSTDEELCTYLSQQLCACVEHKYLQILVNEKFRKNKRFVLEETVESWNNRQLSKYAQWGCVVTFFASLCGIYYFQSSKQTIE